MATLYASVDQTDVPFVSARELSVAVKLLTLQGASLSTAHTMSDAALRDVFAAYWSLVPRDSARKTATLVRLQHLIDACSSRKMQRLLAEHGKAGVAHAVTAAASSRLNVRFGLNPLKIARAVHAAMAVDLRPAALPEMARAA